MNRSPKISARKSRAIALGSLLFANIYSSYAQVEDMTQQLESWSSDIKTILNAIVGIFAIVGGFLIFVQYMQGNEQAQKNFIRFVIGLAIFGLIAFVANIFLPGANIDTNFNQ